MTVEYTGGHISVSLGQGLNMLSAKESDVLFHLGYEWWMFRATYALLQQLPISDDPVRNALLESLLIHGRGLIDFFFDFGHKPTDWVVSDLGIGLSVKARTPELSLWRIDVNKRVAHLTDTRKASLTDINIEPIFTELGKCISEVKAMLKANIPSDWIGDKDTGTLLVNTSVAGVAGSATGAIGATGPAKI